MTEDSWRFYSDTAVWTYLTLLLYVYQERSVSGFTTLHAKRSATEPRTIDPNTPRTSNFSAEPVNGLGESVAIPPVAEGVDEVAVGPAVPLLPAAGFWTWM